MSGLWANDTQYGPNNLQKDMHRLNDVLFLASPDAQEVMWVSESVTDSGLADLTDVTLVSDDTFRRLGTWVTHDHLSSVIKSVRPS